MPLDFCHKKGEPEGDQDSQCQDAEEGRNGKERLRECLVPRALPFEDGARGGEQRNDRHAGKDNQEGAEDAPGTASGQSFRTLVHAAPQYVRANLSVSFACVPHTAQAAAGYFSSTGTPSVLMSNPFSTSAAHLSEQIDIVKM